MGFALALETWGEARVYLQLHDQGTFLLCAMFLGRRWNDQLGPPEYLRARPKRSKENPRPLVTFPTLLHYATPRRCLDHASQNPIVE